jgi:hypothetical protein
MNHKLIAAASIAAVATAANAGLVTEFESNDTIATANFAGTLNPPGGSILIDGTITEGDVDWFSFTVAGDMAFGGAAVFSSVLGADGQLMLVDSASNIIAFDDDSNVDLLPSIQFGPLAAGTYFLGVSAFPDVGVGETPSLFDGLDAAGSPHTEDFAYKLIVGINLVPAPGAVALAGMGGLVMTRRRR